MEKNISKKLQLEKWEFLLIIISLIIFFEPQMFKEGGYDLLIKIDFIYKILKLFFGSIILFIYLKRNKPTKLFTFMSVFQILCFLVTLLNSGSITRFVGPAITTLVMIACVELLINSELLFKSFEIIKKYFRICFFINLISIFLIDGYNIFGLNELYFLGIDNRWIFSYYPWITIEFLSAINKKGKIDFIAILYFILSEVTLIYKQSIAAAIISLIWFLVFVKLYDKRIYKNNLFFISAMIANISVVIFKIQYLFKDLIDLLKKDVTLSGRIYIWDKVLKMPIQNILLGKGMQSIDFDKDFFASSYNYQLPFLYVVHAHNSFITILYRFGIFSLLIYIYIIYICFKNLIKNSGRYSYILCISLFIALLLSIFDSFDCAGFYFVLACSFSVSTIENISCKVNIRRKVDLKTKKKVLFAVYRLENGGIEQMIYNYVSNINRDKFQIDIVTQIPRFEVSEKKFLELGVNIYGITPKNKNIFLWFKELYSVMKINKYDIVHANINSKNFYILFVAKLLNVKVRIAHSHTVAFVSGKRKYIYAFYKKLTKLFATDLVACGESAGKYAYGNNSEFTCIYNGIDLNKFKYSEKNRKLIRKRMKINDNDLCIGHIGRFEPVKNHKFIIELAANLVKKQSNIKFLLIGNGPLKNEIEELIERKQLERNFVLLDATDEVYKYYSAMDVFVLPSFFEGFPLTGIEAQCSGLNCYFSSKISNDINIINKQCNFLSIDEIENWVKILKTNNSSRMKSYEIMKNTNFNIKNGVKMLQKYYETCLEK